MTKRPYIFEKKIQKFEEADQQTPPESGLILFTGSSSIRLWDLKKSFPDLDAINRGFGGSTIPDALHYYDRIVRPYQPRQIIFYSGENDIALNATPEQVLESFKTFSELTREAFPETEIIYVSMKYSPSRKHLTEKFQKGNELIRKYCEENEQRKFLDVNSFMLDEQGQPRPELFVKDQLHMNQAGYDIWIEQLLPELAVPVEN